MKLLLTGSTGFLGQHLHQHLSVNHDILAPTHRELDLADPIAVEAYLKQEYFDAVIHTAVAGREQVQDQNHSIVDQNLQMFFNLYSLRDHYTTFISFGSGAEFGLDRDIDQYSEDKLLECFPKESYGFSKNIIARTIRNTEHFYNLRLYSCFHDSESDKRLLKKFINSINNDQAFYIDNDRYVDFISLDDVAVVVDAVLAGVIIDRDLNVVYTDKIKVSELLTRYCQIHNIDPDYVKIASESDLNYTGDGTKIQKYDLGLLGLDKSLRKYRCYQ